MNVLAVVLGLLAAAFYGSADFCGGLASKRTSVYSVTVISQAAGFVLLLCFAFFIPSHATLTDMEWGGAAGIFGGIGLALLYHALSIGKMGVVSPITAVLAAAVPVVVGVTIRHEALAWWQFVGIGVALAAVVLISLSHDDDGKIEFATAGVKEAIVCGIVLGVFYLCLASASKSAGMQPLLAARATSAAFLVLCALVARASLAPKNNTLGLIVFAGCIDMTANALYVLASHAGYVAIAAVLTSLYPASTVILARVVLRERLHITQKSGVVLALAGVALIAW